MTTDPLDLLELAARAAREAAAYVRAERPSGRVEVAATKSSDTDPVTRIDRGAERVVVDRLLAERPDDGVLGEEGGVREGTSGVRWVIDPIDGTVNFVYGIERYAVSVAAELDGVVVAGAVVDVVHGTAWLAARGHGAVRERGDVRETLRLPEPPPLASALVGTGFSYDADRRARQGAAVARLLPQVRDVRRIGAASLDLCSVADGTLDAYVEEGLQPWDHAAAGLVVTEAGGALGGHDGRPGERLVTAVHPALEQEFSAVVRACGF
ncbi:inositol monophosphatase family protein [Aeromicrobium sp. IC_218]|uniref:inositol monophosphatase family protein n=1 Tax=Aeromicrobium sp. IC_218 TaxID=2545468 RepID=UPI00103B22D9|nr:inositol monophosphatase family protein [Aeromicrobium sp. IC_218]TCJ00120.1 inositol monophosphatase [Aeromicrobium sp. IC_218]